MSRNRASVGYRASIERVEGIDAAVLGSPSGLEAHILPFCGANLCRLAWKGHPIIDFDPELLRAHDFTGTPVLYPTPNRVRGGVLSWNGRQFQQIKRGRRVVEHGLVHDEPWSFAPPAVRHGAARFDTWIDFDEGSELYFPFPFRQRLSLSYELTGTRLQVRYSVENRGGEDLPYGFGLHPYFRKLAGEEAAEVVLPARDVMETTTDLLPTGKLLPVGGTPLDLGDPTPIGSLDLDHVFTGIPEGASARILYRSLGFAVRIEATPDFAYVVLYTPPGEPFFCLENQTCSTDAHNLFDRGLASGLQIVPPGRTRSGTLTYRVEPI